MENGCSSPKILFVTRSRSSRGGHVVLTNIIRELCNEGYDVSVTTFESPERINLAVPYWDNLNVNYIEVSHAQGRDSEQIAHIKAASVYIKQNIDKFDRIIVDSWFIAIAVIRENIFSDKIFQLVQSNPSFIPDNQSEFWKAELFDLLPITPMNRIVVSQALATHFKKKYQKEFNHIRLFVDEIYLKARFEVESRETLRIVSSSATFNVGTKGLDFLLDELEKIRDMKFELTLICMDEIKKDLNQYSFPINIKCVRNPEEMCEELCQHDVYVNTSMNEAFCLALAEAIAIGMPSIALDSIGNREYMDGQNAVFIKNTESFLSEILKLNNFEFRKELSMKAKNSMKKFTLDNTVSELKNIVKI